MIRNPNVGNTRVRAVASRLYAAGVLLARNAESTHSYCTPSDCRVAVSLAAFNALADYIETDAVGYLTRADELLMREGVNFTEIGDDGK